MQRKLRKATGIAIIIVTVLSAFLCSCGKFSDENLPKMEAVAKGYLNAMLSGNEEAAVGYMFEDADIYGTIELTSDAQRTIIRHLMAHTEYHITEVKQSHWIVTGYVYATLHMPNVLAILDSPNLSNMSLNEVLSAIDTTSDYVDEELMLTLKMDTADNNWYIYKDGANAFFRIYAGNTERELSMIPISSREGTQIVSEFMTMSSSGEFTSALNLLDDPSIFPFETDAEAVSLDSFMASYFSMFVYDTSSAVNEDGTITVSISGTRRDPDVFFAGSLAESDVVVPLLADLTEAFFANTDAASNVRKDLYSILSDHTVEFPEVTFSCELCVYLDENGNILIRSDEVSELLFDPDAMIEMVNSDSMLMQRMYPEALELLLEEGRISRSDYDDALGMVSIAEENGITASFAYGDSLYNADYSILPQSLIVHLRTWDSYGAGSVFEYTINVNGQNVVSREPYQIGSNGGNNLYVGYELSDHVIPAGNYEFIVYEQGENNEEILCRALITLEEDVETLDSEVVIPASEPTAPVGEGNTSYEGDSDDLYGFFIRSSENAADSWSTVYREGDTGIYLRVVTWANYDFGSLFVYDIYKDGSLVLPSQIASIGENGSGEDTLFLRYVPEGGLEPGDYTFVLYDHGAETVHSRIYINVVANEEEEPSEETTEETEAPAET